jgi:hypothetical protein
VVGSKNFHFSTDEETGQDDMEFIKSNIVDLEHQKMEYAMKKFSFETIKSLHQKLEFELP